MEPAAQAPENSYALLLFSFSKVVISEAISVTSDSVNSYCIIKGRDEVANPKSLIS